MSQIVRKLIIATKGNQRLIQAISLKGLCTTVLNQSVENKYLKIKSKKEIINIIVKNFLFSIKSRTKVVIERGLLHIKD